MHLGDRISRYNDQDIEAQLHPFLPSYTKQPTPLMRQFALDMLFAGTHNKPRKITVIRNNKSIDYFPDAYSKADANALLETKILNAHTDYVKINNCLYNNDLIAAFDQFIDSVLLFKNLVIDLTETPSGGNTTVARCMMGRFIHTTLPYQKHVVDEAEFDTKRIWIEYVSPRKKQFKGKVYVLVGHWTGSMGEGIAIGFHAINHATIVGTAMAGLLGAIENFRLPETNIGYQFPTEKLYHINGTPREQFIPTIRTKHSFETLQFIQSIK